MADDRMRAVELVRSSYQASQAELEAGARVDANFQEAVAALRRTIKSPSFDAAAPIPVFGTVGPFTRAEISGLRRQRQRGPQQPDNCLNPSNPGTHPGLR